MTFDDLQSPWQESNGGLMSPEKREELVARVCRQVERLGATIIRRDVIETVAAVAVVLFFCGVFPMVEEIVAKIGMVIVVIGACYIVYKLHQTRMDRTPSRLDASLRDFCKTEIERVDRQIELLRSVLWWYISPMFVGVNLVYFGIIGFGIGSMVYALFTVFLGWAIYSMNQKAVDKSLVPVRDELSDLLRELGENV